MVVCHIGGKLVRSSSLVFLGSFPKKWAPFFSGEEPGYEAKMLAV